MQQDEAYSICVIGPFRIFAPDCNPIEIKNARAAALLAVLVMKDDFVSERSELYNLLWSSHLPGSTERKLRDNLRHCISALKSTLGAEGFERLFDMSNRRMIRLNREAVRTDLKEILASLSNGKRTDLSLLLGTGPLTLFGDLDIPKETDFDEWLRDHRSVWASRLADTILNFEKLTQTDPLHSVRSERAAIALRLQPENEVAHRALIMAHAVQGNVLSARRQFDHLVAFLENEFGWEPSEETVRLIDDVNAGHIRAAAAPKPANMLGVPTERVRLAVAPFQVLPVEEDGGVLRVGICDRIIDAISKINEIAVVAQSHVYSAEAKKMSPLELARMLQVDYVLEGTIRHVSNEIFVSTRLIQFVDSEIVLTMEFRQGADTSFVIEDEIARDLAGHLEPRLLNIEINRAMRQPITEGSEARDWVLRSIPLIYQLEREDFDLAYDQLTRALNLDETYAPAHTWMAFWHAFVVGQGWGDQGDLSKANKHARRAIELDPEDSRAYAIAGHVCSFLLGQPELGEYLLDKSLNLNPNSGFAWAFSAINQCYLGDPKEGLKRMTQYSSLCPHDPFSYFFDTIYCIAHMLLGEFDEGSHWGRRATSGNPNFINGLKPFLACLGHLGRTSEADILRQQILDEQPGFSISFMRQNYPLRDEAQMQRYCDGLRKAGVPE